MRSKSRAQQDAYFARTGEFVGPLHGIPVAVKDNYDTADMRTTAGADALYANDKPPQDATMVAKLRAAGAIILGKTNLDEYAPAGIGRSTLGGQTCNPYDTRRITGGSSAGSAAAVAANLAFCALGTDTVGSVRYPSALNALVGIVATQGLTSRAGIVPLSFSRDRGGPLCRTVEDTAAMLAVLTGEDPRDNVTAIAHARKPVDYASYTGRKSLAGKRLGVVRDFMIEATLADRDSVQIGNEALADMKQLGATVVDPVDFSRRHRRNHDGVRTELLYADISGCDPRRREADRSPGNDCCRSETPSGRRARRQPAHVGRPVARQ